ncbi:microsomal signal peptidase subunit [Aspergillus cavernicola]|uniref:Signal peptidase subunit 3 n=1 Tax=Aspergillus cavernicola TaxID=176166 RepID=A0ABR4IE08_9EURO
MYSTLNRAQAVFGFFTTVALVVAGFAALSVVLYPTDTVTADVELKDVKVIKGRPHYYSTKKEEYAQMRFDLDADLSPLFNWNTKQLFVYVYASYSSANDNTNTNIPNTQSIIWDKIIEAPESPYSFANLRERFFPAKTSSSGQASNKRSPSSSSSTKNTNKKKKDEPTPGLLRLRDQRSKYQISDITGKMAERSNVTLSVGWNVQPWVGALWWSPGSGAAPRTEGKTGLSKAFDLPMLKGSKPKAAEGERAASV